MNVYEAIMNRRTIRKFKQKPVDNENLIRLVDCARVAAYGANIQPLKFAIINNMEMCDKVFEYIKWAGYLKDGTPVKDERPMAYIAILGDLTIKSSSLFETDAGAAVTTMMLAAEEIGLGSCWLGAIDREKIHNVLGLQSTIRVVYLLALGYTSQESRMVDMNGDVKYYLDDNNTLCVPKRSLNEVLIEI